MKFVPGQKVICIKPGYFFPIGTIAKVHDVLSDGRLVFCRNTSLTMNPDGFETIIESIEDVIPGMTLTVVDAVDRNNTGWMEKYDQETYSGWDRYLGKTLTVGKISVLNKIRAISFANSGYIFPIEMIKEYPGNVGIKNGFGMLKFYEEAKPEEKVAKIFNRSIWPEKSPFAQEAVMGKKYKITEEYRLGITLADIYDKKPSSCSDWDREFSRFLKTDRTYLDEGFINSADCFPIWKDWLLEWGFIEEVKPEFNTIRFGMDVKSKDVLLELWHRLNPTTQLSVTDGLETPSDWINTIELWKEVDSHCKRLGLRK